MNLINTEWLKANLNKVKIFDATWHMPDSKRNAKEEYYEKHIPGAIFWDLDKHSDKNSSYPHMMPNSDYWAEMLCGFGIKNEDHIVVYDFSDVYSSCRLWFSLKYFGHKNVSVLDGGLFKWLSENRPTTNKINKILPKSNYKIKENHDWIKNKEQVNKNIKKNSFILVDARSRDRFQGKIEEPRPGLAKGCIPGSKNIPYQNCIDNQMRTFKKKSELIKIFNENDVDYNKSTVFSCGSGVTACVLGLAYSLITDKNALIYDGSFSEWGKK